MNGVNLHLIPLQERPEDINLPIHHFMEFYASEENKHPEISSEVLSYLKAYRWRGNIRELQNVIHRAVVLACNEKVNPTHLPPEVTVSGPRNEDLITLEELEKLHIKKALQLSTDYKEAAKILGIDLTTLWRKRKKILYLIAISRFSCYIKIHSW